MITVLLAWINAKYKAGYKELFIGTVLVDFTILSLIEGLMK